MGFITFINIPLPSRRTWITLLLKPAALGVEEYRSVLRYIEIILTNAGATRFSYVMASLPDVRMVVESLHKCSKGSTKSEYREFTSGCVQLARFIDQAIAKHQKLPVAQSLIQFLKKICEQKKDNEMFQPAIMVLILSLKNAIYFNWFTPSEGQEILRMSKELIDFFTGVGGWNAIDKNEASKMISGLITKFYPLFSLLSVIVALEAKPGYEAMVCDFYVLKKTSNAEELRMFVVQKDNQDTSSCLVTPNHVNFLLNGKGVEKRSMISMDTGPQMPSNVSGMVKIGTNLLQIVGDFPGTYLIAIALTTTTAEFSSPLNLEIYNNNGAKAQADDDLIEGPSRVSLLCPISHKRIISPVKGSSCKHHQCFDYNSFMEINSRRPAWRCPFCNRHVSFPALRLDLQMLKILKETKDNAVDLMVSNDGSWTALNEETLNRNVHRKASKSGDSPVEEGEICTESEASLIELSDREEVETCALIDRNVYQSIGGDIEDRKPDTRELNAAMFSHVRNGQHSIAESNIIAPHGVNNPSITQMTQSLHSEGIVSEAQLERHGHREINRTPIAIQTLPSQTANPNLNYRVRPSAQAATVVHPNGQLGINQQTTHMQLQGSENGHFLVTAALSLQRDEFLNVTQSQQAVPDAQDQWQRFQNLQQHPVPQQPAQRTSRDHSHVTPNRNANSVRTFEGLTGNQQNSSQGIMRTSESLNGNPQNIIGPDTTTMLGSQIWRMLQTQQVQQTHVQPLQQRFQPQAVQSYVTQDELSHTGIPEVLPMNSHSFTGSLPVANTMRQNAPNARAVSSQYLQPTNNTTNTMIRDQRLINNTSYGQSLMDFSTSLLQEQIQRPSVRMRGSITNSSGTPRGPCNSNLSWTHGGFSHVTQVPLIPNNLPYRFSTGIIPNLSRQTDLSRSNIDIPQSIQTASTIVTDFDNWLNSQPSGQISGGDNWEI